MGRSDWLIYGANGYTGALTAQMAVERGMRPILAGRNTAAVGALAQRLGLAARSAALDDPQALDRMLAGCHAVLHCAGPFVHTAKPMADACLRNGVHYLDITGEISVFEALAARYAEARSAGVMLLPGAGFDVVPSDCLAAHLNRRAAGGLAAGAGYPLFWRRLARHGDDDVGKHRARRGGLVRRGRIGADCPLGQKPSRSTLEAARGPPS
jgi:short subunit dehydrogenase-like uncharacterized protein